VNGKPIQQKIGRERRARRPRRRPRCLRHLRRASAGTGQAASGQRGVQRVQVGLAGQVDIDGLEPAGGFQQQWGGIAAPVRRERELGSQEINAGTLEFVQRCGLGHAEQLDRGIERARLDLGLSSGQGSGGPRRGLRGQRRRALEERGRGGQTPACLRPAGRAFQFGGHRLVWPGRGAGQMPGPPVSVGVRIGRLGQSPVRRPPVGCGGRPVDRGARQRMAEVHRGAELDQSRGLGRRRGVGRGRRASIGATVAV
jgi:hypothetical protein